MGIRLICQLVERGGHAKFLAKVWAVGLMIPAAVGAWEVSAPVLAAVPVYASAGPVACPGAAPGPLTGTPLAAQLAADLERAACRTRSPAIVGWKVTYRFDGRTLRTFSRERPGEFVPMRVRVIPSVPGNPGRQRPGR